MLRLDRSGGDADRNDLARAAARGRNYNLWLKFLATPAAMTIESGMDRYFIRPDGEAGYLIEVKFADGTETTVRGFDSEEEAERWIEDRRRERRRVGR